MRMHQIKMEAMEAKKLILGLKKAFIWCISSIQRVNNQ